jgi:hypothetical protein
VEQGLAFKLFKLGYFFPQENLFFLWVFSFPSSLPPSSLRHYDINDREGQRRNK